MTQIFIMYVYFFSKYTYLSIIQPFAIYHHQKGMYLFFSLYLLGGGFKYFLFSPLFEDMIQFD